MTRKYVQRNVHEITLKPTSQKLHLPLPVGYKFSFYFYLLEHTLVLLMAFHRCQGKPAGQRKVKPGHPRLCRHLTHGRFPYSHPYLTFPTRLARCSAFFAADHRIRLRDHLWKILGVRFFDRTRIAVPESMFRWIVWVVVRSFRMDGVPL